jgi:adenylate kinase
LPLENTQPPLIILFGPPGSGKGTQANLISTELGSLNLSIGNSVRAFIRQFKDSDPDEFERVKRLETRMESGELQDFEDVKYIVEKEIRDSISKKKNVLIEGLPRTPEQAEWLAGFFKQSDVKCLFFHFVLPQSVILERLSHRFYAPGNENPYSSYEDALKHCKDGQLPVRRKDDEDINVIKHRLDAQYNDCKDDILSTIDLCPTVTIFDIDATPAPDQIYVQLKDLILKNSN